MTNSLSTFIAHARKKGMDHQTIRLLLLSAGWKEKDISEALASETLDMPVPLPPDAGSARDAFFHLLSFTSLTATVVSLIILFFQYWDRLFPDVAFPSYGTAELSTIRWSIAAVIVSFPLYLWMMRVLRKEMSKHPEKLNSGVRRWLTYLILFVTACTLVGDLITVLSSLLEGELTLRFILKAATIFLLCGLPFYYYFQTLRMDATTYAKSPLHAQFRWLSIVIVLVAVVWGFFIIGSPSYGRAEKLDEARVNDLRAIQSEIFNQVWEGRAWEPKGVPPPTKLPKPLPETLDEVAANATFQKLRIMDPETEQPYEYIISTPSIFKLCATFTLARDQQYDIFWDHSAGYHCYEFDALSSQMR